MHRDALILTVSVPVNLLNIHDGLACPGTVHCICPGQNPDRAMSVEVEYPYFADSHHEVYASQVEPTMLQSVLNTGRVVIMRTVLSRASRRCTQMTLLLRGLLWAHSLVSHGGALARVILIHQYVWQPGGMQLTSGHVRCCSVLRQQVHRCWFLHHLLAGYRYPMMCATRAQQAYLHATVCSRVPASVCSQYFARLGGDRLCLCCCLLQARGRG